MTHFYNAAIIRADDLSVIPSPVLGSPELLVSIICMQTQALQYQLCKKLQQTTDCRQQHDSHGYAICTEMSATLEGL